MGYYNGTANDMAALQTAIAAACTAEGWSLSGNVLSKSGMHISVSAGTFRSSPVLRILPATGSASGVLSGSAPRNLIIGGGGYPVSFPLGYEVFVFAAEVFVVVNYNVDYYQWAAWGMSTVLGLAGTGMWAGATAAEAGTNGSGFMLNATSGGSNLAWGYSSGALFWATADQYSSGAGYGKTCVIHHDLDGRGWELGTAAAPTNFIGISAAAPLIGILPNAWNSEAVLLPLRCYAARLSSKVSPVADLEHARHTRVDNYTPGEVITIGSDRWKIFPWHRKDTANRNGGIGIGHTGTFGWAIRYEGP